MNDDEECRDHSHGDQRQEKPIAGAARRRDHFEIPAIETARLSVFIIQLLVGVSGSLNLIRGERTGTRRLMTTRFAVLAAMTNSGAGVPYVDIVG